MELYLSPIPGHGARPGVKDVMDGTTRDLAHPVLRPIGYGPLDCGGSGIFERVPKGLKLSFADGKLENAGDIGGNARGCCALSAPRGGKRLLSYLSPINVKKARGEP